MATLPSRAARKFTADGLVRGPEDAAREVGRRTFPGALVYLVVIGVVATVTDVGRLFPRFAAAMFAAQLVLGPIRVVLGRRLAMGALEQQTSATRRHYYAATLASLFGWGLFSGFAVFHRLEDSSGMLTMVCAAALTAGAGTSLAPNFALASAAVTAMSVPIIIGVVARADRFGFSVAFLSLVYFYFLMVQLKWNSEAFQVSLDLNEAERIADESRASAKAKTMLLASVSHEIRTPINGVVGSLELLLAAPHHEHTRELLGLAHSSAMHLSQLVDRVLDSTDSAARVKLAIAPFDLQLTVRRALGNLRILAQQKGVACIESFEPDLHPAYSGDSVRITQIITNLVGNAIKFSDTGCVRVHTFREGPAEGDDWIRISVNDTGPGIEPDSLEKIFEPFVQANPDIGARYGGSGLGLSISRGLARLMGGEISVESALGVGSTFTVRLPLAPASIASVPPASAPQAEEEPDRPVANPAGARLLVVEDNAINRRLTSAMLSKLGIVVDVAVDGQEAVDAFALRHYDLILMDCQMPRMDGWAATRNIRLAEKGGVRVPIVGLSASAFAEDRANAIEAGMDDYLTKPISAVDLTRCVSALLDAGRPKPN